MNEEFSKNAIHKVYPCTIDPRSVQLRYRNFDNFVKKFADRPAFTCLGQTLTYGELNEKALPSPLICRMKPA